MATAPNPRFWIISISVARSLDGHYPLQLPVEAAVLDGFQHVFGQDRSLIERSAILRATRRIGSVYRVPAWIPKRSLIPAPRLPMPVTHYTGGRVTSGTPACWSKVTWN